MWAISGLLKLLIVVVISATIALLILPAWHLSAVQGLPVCAPLPVVLWYTSGVPLATGAHNGPAPPLPAHADAACSTGHVGNPCSHLPLSSDARHAAHVGLPHTTRRNHARSDGAVPPARPAGARLPTPRAGSSSEVQLQLEGGQAETKASDGQRQR